MESMDSTRTSSSSSSVLDWSGPHAVVIPRVNNDFGFTLRHLVVYPPQSVLADSGDDRGHLSKDSPPSLSRELSNTEPQETIFVKSVKEGSSAYCAGLNIGDRILAINGEPISNKLYRDVIAAINQSEHTLRLLVVPKDEDILQMAYQSQARDCMFASTTSLSDNVRLSGVSDPHQHIHSSSDIVHGTALDKSCDASCKENLPYGRHEIRHSFPLSQWEHGGAEFRLDNFSSNKPSQDHIGEPLLSETCINQAVTDTAFLSQQQPNLIRQDGEPNMASNITYNIPSRSKYSFGLYFTPKSSAVPSINDSAGTDSLDGAYKDSADRPGLTKSQTFEVSNRRSGSTSRKTSLDDNSALSSSAKSREFFIRYSSDKAASDNRNRYSPRYSTYERYSSDNRPTYIISRSQTVSTISPSLSSGVEQSLRKSSDYIRPGQGSTQDSPRPCQYIPVISENKQQINIEGIEKRTDMGSIKQSPAERTDSNTGSKTFVLSIPCGQQSKTTESSYIPVRQRFGTTYTLTRSPTAAHIEIQKSIGQPIVSQRKYQFETRKDENTPPSVANDGHSRFKTEIAKIRTQPKFSSFAMRKASFEMSPERDPPGYDSSFDLENQTSLDVSLDTAQPTVKVRRMSSERFGSESHQQSEGSVGKSQDTTSITIIVSPDNSTSSIHGPTENLPILIETINSLNKPTVLSSSHDGSAHSPSNSIYGTTDSIGVGGGSNGTGLADSGVWMKSCHSSSDMLDAADEVSGDVVSATEQEGSIAHKSDSSQMTNRPVVNFQVQKIVSVTDSVVAPAQTEAVHDVQEFVGNASVNVAVRRKVQESLEDQANKLHRRTSYLMATARDRANTVPLEETFSASHDALNQKAQHVTGTARRNSSVKLNKFFGEMIPSITEGVEMKSTDYEEVPEIIRKGPLYCKVSAIDGKKCSDRTWKSVHAVLRPSELLLSRDKEGGSGSSNGEDLHIPLKSCTVEFVREYAKKKKNVFRLSTPSGCDYLFQTEDRGMLMCWIQGIKSVNEPDRAEEVMTSEREKQVQSPIEINIIPSSKTSPQMSQKGKKLSALSFKSKLTSSPNMKRKKSNATEKDKEEVLKKGWKDRIPMMKSLKKHSEDSNLLMPAEHEVDTDKFQFGVHLEDCFPSPHNEYVPLIVELCTRIVEARGLEVVGVYRVPGNSAAVTALTEEFNRGIDSVNIDNEKLLDINVISSLLKSFFRKLPEPLIPTDKYEAFIEANRYPDEDKRKLKIKRLLHLLPAHHNETLKHMAEHLNKVASYGNINKMDAKNLAIMFGPTLVRKKGDDTISLVTDMSDQCRIVESIILHHDWFFSPWDQDSYIPMETTVETISVEDGQNMSKDDDEEADSAISTKEIISSIVGAASKKLRQQQQQKSLDSLDMVDASSTASIPTFRDRNISDTSYLTSLAKSMSSINSSLGASEEFLGRKSSMPSPRFLSSHTAGHNTSTGSDFTELEYADASSPSSSGFSGHLSDDFIHDKNDELEISHNLSNNNRDAIDRLKKIGENATALLHSFEQKRQKERELRRQQQELVEREHIRTQRELELEDSHSIDDWIAWESGMPDLVSSSYFWETPYSQSFSDLPATSRERKETQDRQHSRLTADAHAKVKVASVSPQVSGPSPTQPCQMCKGGSHEDILRHSKSQDFGKAAVARKSNQRKLQEKQPKTMHLTFGGIMQRPASLRNSLGKRHGSLDSLIDMIDKQEKRISWASTDSEDGTDLLTSITTTFDQKLEILLNPKYKLTGTGKKSASKTEASGTTEGAIDWDSVWQTKGGASRPPVNKNQVYTVASLLESDRPFRDPSLHRSARSDPKIGIASRFERTDIGKATSSSLMAVPSTNTASLSGQQPKDQQLDTKPVLDNRPSKDCNYVTLSQSPPNDPSLTTKIIFNEKPEQKIFHLNEAENKYHLPPFSEKFSLKHTQFGASNEQQEELVRSRKSLARHIYRRPVLAV